MRKPAIQKGFHFLRVIAALGLAGIALGIGIGAFFRNAGDSSVFQYFFGKQIKVPGAMPDGSFVLADFESTEGAQAWQTDRASLDAAPHTSGTHPWMPVYPGMAVYPMTAQTGPRTAPGSKGGRMVFHAGDRPAAVTLERYFTSRGGLFDWSNYRALSFYLANAASEPASITFQVMDRKKRHFKHSLRLEAGQGGVHTFPMDVLDDAVNIKRIAHIRFFIWHPGRGAEFFLDDLKLEPGISRKS